MILGSHNSWTFRKPNKWYMRPFTWITRCQNKNINEQVQKKASYFDLRVRLDTNSFMWYVAHGCMTFGKLPYDDLSYLNSLQGVYVRVILEYNKKPLGEKFIHEQFASLCKKLEKGYPNITFVGGHSKYQWSNVIYVFKEKEPKLIDAYSSMQGNKIDDLWPWLWAKKHNKEFFNKYKDTDEIVLMDFINNYE